MSSELNVNNTFIDYSFSLMNPNLNLTLGPATRGAGLWVVGATLIGFNLGAVAFGDNHER